MFWKFKFSKRIYNPPVVLIMSSAIFKDVTSSDDFIRACPLTSRTRDRQKLQNTVFLGFMSHYICHRDILYSTDEQSEEIIRYVLLNFPLSFSFIWI